jgi:hypothetical protein
MVVALKLLEPHFTVLDSIALFASAICMLLMLNVVRRLCSIIFQHLHYVLSLV